MDSERVERAPNEDAGDHRASSTGGGGGGIVSGTEALELCLLWPDRVLE